MQVLPKILKKTVYLNVVKNTPHPRRRRQGAMGKNGNLSILLIFSQGNFGIL